MDLQWLHPLLKFEWTVVFFEGVCDTHPHPQVVFCFKSFPSTERNLCCGRGLLIPWSQISSVIGNVSVKIDFCCPCFLLISEISKESFSKLPRVSPNPEINLTEASNSKRVILMKRPMEPTTEIRIKLFIPPPGS